MTCARQDRCQHGDGCFVASDYDVARCTAFKSKVQTNEEWIKSANTEQLAEFLDRISDFCEMCENHCDNDTGMQCNGDFKGHWVEWLKQPHTREERKK